MTWTFTQSLPDSNASPAPCKETNPARNTRKREAEKTQYANRLRRARQLSGIRSLEFWNLA